MTEIMCLLSLFLIGGAPWFSVENLVSKTKHIEIVSFLLWLYYSGLDTYFDFSRRNSAPYTTSYEEMQLRILKIEFTHKVYFF